MKFSREMKIFFWQRPRYCGSTPCSQCGAFKPKGNFDLIEAQIRTLGFNIKVTDLDVIAIKGISPNRELWPKESRERPQGL